MPGQQGVIKPAKLCFKGMFGLKKKKERNTIARGLAGAREVDWFVHL